MTQPRIHVLGLKELRAAFRTMDAGLAREVGKALKAGATIASDQAKRTVRHKSGDLADSVNPGAAGVRAYVRSRLVYAGVQEYGGRVGINRSVRITPSRRINEAVDDRLPEIVDKVGDELDALARRNGF